MLGVRQSCICCCLLVLMLLLLPHWLPAVQVQEELDKTRQEAKVLSDTMQAQVGEDACFNKSESKPCRWRMELAKDTGTAYAFRVRIRGMPEVARE